MNRVKIKDKDIGLGKPLYIIAEMACAHDGDVSHAKKLIAAAAGAGADAVQLQFFSVKDLMTPDHEVYDLLTKIEFSIDQWQEIYHYARQFDIHVFACTYDVPSAELAIELKVDGIKLNSSDLSNPDLLEIVSKSNIPFTLGTGASTIEEITRATHAAVGYGCEQIIIMHGVQNFPTEVTHANINKIDILQSLFPFPVGYQDHTDASDPFSRVIDLMAVAKKVSAIEKHITLDRSKKGTDYQASLEPEEFKEFVTLLRKAETALGPDHITPLRENDMVYRKFQKKSIVAAADLAKGEPVTRNKIKFLRSPEPGLSPDQAHLVLGKKATRNIRKFTTLAVSDTD